MTDAQIMALAMFKDAVPYVMSMMPDINCHKRAAWLVEVEHLGKDCGEMQPNPIPMCAEHKNMLVQSMNPFWATYLGAPAPTCSACHTEISVGQVAAI
jgi:hypothetical protein